MAGATGIIGRAITQALTVDLLDKEQSLRQFASLTEVTHLFYSAYIPYRTYAEEITPNLALLVNVIEGLEAAGAPLQHVTLVTGAKYYGVHLGPIPTPAREEQPTTIGPIFNRVQEDYLRSRKKLNGDGRISLRLI